MFVGVLVLCSVVGLSAFLYSPWHKHARLDSVTCPFTGFEHGVCEGRTAHAIAPQPPALGDWFHGPSLPGRTASAETRVARDRAPPAA